MIEIEYFQREPSCGIHTLKIWVGGHLVFANEIGTIRGLLDLRAALNNELLWMNQYFREKGIKDDYE